jgi:hypothetical protein
VILVPLSLSLSLSFLFFLFAFEINLNFLCDIIFWILELGSEIQFGKKGEKYFWNRNLSPLNIGVILIKAKREN